MKKNLIELKNFKHHDDMSEETLCFTADVWIGGYKAGYARNGGYGGPTDVSPYDAKGKELIKFAQAEIESMPPEVVEFMGKTLTINSTLDNYIDGLVEKKIKEKEDKRISTWVNKHLPTGIVAEIGSRFYHFPFNSIHTDIQKKQFAYAVMKKYPDCKILNKL